METREIIDKYYATANAGDWQAWLTLFHDDVVGDEQIAGHFEGIGVLRGAADGIQQGYKKFLMHPQHIVVQGGEAMVVWRNESENAHGMPIGYQGDPYRPVIGANYFRIENGKIVYMRTMHDVVPFLPFVLRTQPTPKP